MADHDHSHDVKIPLGVLIGIAALLACTVAAVAFFRYTGMEPIAQVPEPEQVIETRQLRFTDSANGTVEVLEVVDGAPDQLVHIIEPGEGGFIRGVLRSLARARRANGIGNENPFVLIELANGTLLLEDPMTEQRIYLQAFGPASIESFKMLLSSEDAQQ